MNSLFVKLMCRKQKGEIGRYKNLTDFDKGQIVFAKCLLQNGHLAMKTGPWSTGRRRPDLSRFLLHHVDSQLHVCHLVEEEIIPGCTMGRRQVI